MKTIFSMALALAVLLAAAGPALAQPGAPLDNVSGVGRAPLSDIVYIVKAGDTLYSIARRYNTTVAAIVAANGIVNANRISVGQRLIIPAAGGGAVGTGSTTASTTYTVQRGDTLWRIALRYGITLAALKSANGLTSNIIYVGQRLTIPGTTTGAALTSVPSAPTATLAPGAPPPSVLPPTATAVAPTATRVPPTATSVPGGYTSSRGIRGDYFRLRNTSAGVNQDVWFEFGATNTSYTSTRVAGLGAIIPGVWSQASWGDFNWGPPYSDWLLEWEDHINVPRAGTYAVYLGVCWLASRSACEANLNAWDLLSPGVTLTIQ
jgi:LysM repeat protein